ncbi:hypothetical protein IEN85_14695 [Pelagicoccus sp. NFK12]|uniref:GYF domain-containing protein n=1 Tax=Pelagicoccus enzymogenes TaxID=2773457 RepID=A0A927FAG1_9BACT|nr:hypothetical protein [Pelagicoccus enzymogenes]MBD5780746.1 hypothetical protein [Pelagicoccus enzymogenes]
MREYYIRREGDEDASGPFDIDQISSLIEANKLDANAYFYDIESESWLTISSNEELMETLFPKKRKLTLRTQESEEEKKRLAEEEAAKAAAAKAEAKAEGQAESETEGAETEPDDAEAAKASEAAAPEKPAEESKKGKKKKGEPSEERQKLEVTKMLALAEGRADDPSGKSPREKQAAVAFFGLRFLTLFFIASILAMGYIEKDLVMTADAIAMAKSPYIVIAVIDLVITLTLLLQVTEVYPLLRFRAAVGAGLLTMLFYSSGDTLLLFSNLLLMGAIYFSSAIIKIRFLIACGITGVLGILGYVYAFFL